MKRWRYLREVGLVGATASLFVLLGCYTNSTRGTLLLYSGERRSEEQVARIIVAVGGLYHVHRYSGLVPLRDTLELTPGRTRLRLMQPGRT